MDPELTKNATTAPKSATPTALGDGNIISNLAPPTGLEFQEFPTDTDSDIISAGSSGANNDNSTYLGSREKSPGIHDTTLDLSTIIEEVGNIHEVFN